jgi:hypothetical protein
MFFLKKYIILVSMTYSFMPILIDGAIFYAPNGSTSKLKLTGHPR